jgi:hypothetical protein
MWNVVCMTFKHVMDCNMPVEVFAYKPPKGAGKKASPQIAGTSSISLSQVPRVLPFG